jgi:hypothetical protein
VKLAEEQRTQRIPSSFRLALPSTPLPWPDALGTGSCISTGGNACELGYFSRNIAKPAHVGAPGLVFSFSTEICGTVATVALMSLPSAHLSSVRG